ncbi:MAG: disulfide oxidoreductase [Candidatus Hydrothermae bacterium]|nr:disulfide oxidoreductase [Candidatus Hydrothermae bacterium]
MTITPESTIEEVVVRYPDTVQIFFRHGIPAISCGAPIWGTIRENAEKYGVQDLDALLRELNDVAEQQGGLSVRL